MTNNLLYFNFLKMLNRYGAWRYNLFDRDYIYVKKNRYTKIAFSVTVVIDSHARYIDCETQESAWKMVETEIAKYKEAKQVNEG